MGSLTGYFTHSIIFIAVTCKFVYSSMKVFCDGSDTIYPLYTLC